MVGSFIVTLFIGAALVGPYLTPYDVTVGNLADSLKGPTWDHPFGRDTLGRDLFSRVIAGSRISLKVGLIVVGVSVTIGTLLGALAGFLGGWVDELLMRIIDIMLAFPGILLSIAMVAILGPDLNHVIFALCLMGWVGFARLVRGQVLVVRELEYVDAARALGAGTLRIITRHIIPNVMAPVLVQATLGIAGAIVAEAGLSFLGLGVQPPTPSWGALLNEGIDYLRVAPHITIFPGLAVMITVLSLNFLGDGLRDALDPKMEVDRWRL